MSVIRNARFFCLYKHPLDKPIYALFNNNTICLEIQATKLKDGGP